MTKVNIREALNQMDKDTNCKYDLVTLYEGYNFNDEEKKEIAKMISDNKDAEVIYDRLSDKFGKDVDFDDDDISDITLDECNMNADTEDYFDFDDLDEDTIKTSKGKWVNKGDEGTHGTFDTKKEADAQRKAMFASGYKGESLKETEEDSLRDTLFTEYQSKYTPDTHDTIYNEIKDKYNDETLANEVITSLENDYKSWFDESLKEDWRDDKFTEDDFSTYVAKMKSEAYRLSNSIQYMIDKHPEYADLFDNLVSEIVDIFSRIYLNEAISNKLINEASYGGAYEILDDEYFTKDDGIEAVTEILSIIRKNIPDKEFPDIQLGLSDMDLNNRMFRVTLTDEDENEFTEEVQIDMRKIRHPLDLIKKYAPILAEKFIKQINDYYSEM